MYDRRDPVKAYAQADVEAERLLKDIAHLLAKQAEQFGRRQTNWGYVGNIQFVVGKLTEVKEFLDGTAK